MNATPLTSWLWFVVLVLFGPLDAWAAGEGEGTPRTGTEQKDPQQEELDRRRKQQDAGAKKLQDVAKKLHGVCSGSDATGWTKPLTDEKITKVTKELAVVLRDHDRPEADKKAALQVLLYLGKTDDARKFASAVQDGSKILAAHDDSEVDLEQARKNAEKIVPFEALPELTSEAIKKSDIESVCNTYCHSAALYEIDRSAKPTNLEASIKSFRESEKEHSFIDICTVRNDPNLARVAYAVDHVSVEQALETIEATATKEPDGDFEIEIAELNSKKSLPGLGAALVGLLPGPLGAITTAEGLTELAIRLATGLGKLAIDRAKQEAVLWTLGEIGTRVCGNGGGRGVDPIAAQEIRTYWLPQLCDLTSEEKLRSGFGAGQAMFAALVSAVENDAKNLPGAAAGLMVGLAYWTEDNAGMTSASVDFAFDCTGATPSLECIRFKEVRLSTAKAIGGLLRGSDPIDEARAWSAAVDETNRVPKAGDSAEYVLRAPLAQLTACGLAVAAELGADPSRRVVLDPSDTALEPVPELYRVVGALASAPACWTLTGRGHGSADFREHCKTTGLKCESPGLALNRANGNDVERVSTVIRLGMSLKSTQTRAGEAWRKLNQLIGRLQGARDRLSETVRATKTPGDESNSAVIAALAKLDEAELDLDDLRALVDQTKIDKAKDRLSTALDVAEELLAATDATAVLLQDLAEPNKIKISLFPGLLDKTGAHPKWVEQAASSEEKLSKKIEGFRSKLASVQSLIDALRDILAGDWAAGTTKALAAAQHLFPRKAEHATETATTIHDDIANVIDRLEQDKATANGDDAKALDSEVHSLKKIQRRFTPRRLTRLDKGDVTTQLGELIGLITAILSAKDSDDMAVVLEKTASPPGSWRRKQAKGAFTLSLGSHVGVYTAAEFRWGQYGVNRERGTPHWQAFTLAVPIGFDFAWGKGRNSVGFFVPLIDPAAFVQYDVSEKGRLPGPRPLTVLSPGAFFRWGIFRTPITLLAGYVYRPRLRTWEATINEPGADAHQIGVSLAIDATFWNIVKR